MERGCHLSYHFADNLLPRDFGGDVPPAYPAIAHDDDAVGNRKDLGQPVRNKDDGNAARLQGAHLVKEAQQFILRQRCCRFIQDEQAGLLGECAGNHYQLLCGKVERRHRGARAPRRAQILQQLP